MFFFKKQRAFKINERLYLENCAREEWRVRIQLRLLQNLRVLPIPSWEENYYYDGWNFLCHHFRETEKS